MIEAFKNRVAALRLDASLLEVLQGAWTSLVLQTAGAFIGLVVSLVIARLLGAEGSGIYYLAMSVVAIASTLGRVGLDNTVVRHVAARAAAGDWMAVRSVNKAALKIAGAASLAVSLAVLVGARLLTERVFHKDFVRVPIILSALATVPFSLAMIQAESLRGLKDVFSSQLIKNVLVGLGTLLLVYPASLLWHADGAVLAYVVSVVVASVTSWFLWRRQYGAVSAGAELKETDGGPASENLVSDSMPLFGVSISNLVILYGATVMLGMWSAIGDVGVFNAANRVTSLFLFPLFGMINILSPKFAEMHHRGDSEGMARLARQSARILTMIAVPGAGAMFIGAEWVLSLFGPQFASGAAVLRVLLVGVIVNVSTGAVAELLMMTGRGKTVNRVIAMGAVSIVVLSVVLMPSFGGLGAAIALSAGTVMINVVMVFSVKNALGFWPIPLIGRRYGL